MRSKVYEIVNNLVVRLETAGKDEEASRSGQNWWRNAMTSINEAEAYRAIRRSILDGVMHAGHRLVEADLALALGASRSYVRLALARLEFEGLVEKQPGRSASVRRVPRSELLEIIDARVALEGMMARAAATRRTDPQAQYLVRTMQDLVTLGAQSDIAGLLDAQARFHHAVLDASGKPAIERVVQNLAALTAQTRVRSMLLPGRVPASIKEHRAITAAILAADGGAAEAAMIHHLRNVGDAISKLPAGALSGAYLEPKGQAANTQ